MVAKVPPAGITTYKGTPSAGDLGGGLHIKTADSGASVAANYDEIVIENSDHAGMSILTGTDKVGAIRFGDSGDNDIGGLIYNHDGNSFTIKNNAANSLVIDSAGHVTMPLQPYFRCIPASAQNNLSINTWNDIAFATESVDRNADFATATFTAPVTGVYMFTTSLYMQAIDTDFTTVEGAFHTSNDIYQVFILEPGKTFSSDSSYYSVVGSVICDMDASDTCILKIYPAGGAAQMDINVSSTFTGGLLY
tara:strand:+ start:380 stop:1129 length:750 start_codon:yes stop_codon:yes gene_type:complete